MASLAHALEHTYRYQQPSRYRPDRLALVTSLDYSTRWFFEGRLFDPQRVAELLLCVTEVVRSRFHVPPAMLNRVLFLADPVITCHPSCIRFEGFSACASAYARLDLDQSALDGEILNAGTTNVDFNAPMRAALAGIRSTDPVRLSIGMRDVEVETPSGPVTERKVTLPIRWVRSFAEVGLYQARMRPWAEIPGAAFRRFLHQLPSAAKGRLWLAQPGLRLTQRPSPGAIPVGGVPRLRVLSAVARHAESVRIYSGDGESTAWELRTPGARFLLALSGDVWRGFSGEGQALSALAREVSSGDVTRLRASLRWQGTVENGGEAALARCAAMGLLGYDLYTGSWFHRELPFDLEKIDGLNPRLSSARKLIEAVEIETRLENQIRAWVRSNGTDHRVVVGEDPSCTCPWFNKHHLSRGPCKHMLAVEMAGELHGEER